jgi:hypothetical protein
MLDDGAADPTAETEHGGCSSAKRVCGSSSPGSAGSAAVACSAAANECTPPRWRSAWGPRARRGVVLAACHGAASRPLHQPHGRARPGKECWWFSRVWAFWWSCRCWLLPPASSASCEPNGRGAVRSVRAPHGPSALLGAASAQPHRHFPQRPCWRILLPARAAGQGGARFSMDSSCSTARHVVPATRSAVVRAQCEPPATCIGSDRYGVDAPSRRRYGRMQEGRTGVRTTRHAGARRRPCTVDRCPARGRRHSHAPALVHLYG